MNNAIFIIGGPGSGKDIAIKYISEKYAIKEYTIEQLRKSIKKNNIEENFILKGNAYEQDKILEVKSILENTHSTSMIFVDVENIVSKERLSIRHISEEQRQTRFNTSKENLWVFESLFDKFYIFDNNSEYDYLNIEELDSFVESMLDPINYLAEKHINKAKDYVYKKFMLDKDKIKDDKKRFKDFYSHSTLKPDGYNEYDIRMAGQSNVVHNFEDIGSPETLNSLTGMSFSNKDDIDKLDKVEFSPAKTKPTMNKKFNSPAKKNPDEVVWQSAKRIIFGKQK